MSKENLTFRPRVDVDNWQLDEQPTEISEPTRKDRLRKRQVELAERNHALKTKHEESLRSDKEIQQNKDIAKLGVYNKVLTMQSEPNFPNRVHEYHQTLVDEQLRAEEVGDKAAAASAQTELKMLEAIVSSEEVGPWYNKKNMNEKLTANKADYDWQAPRPSIDMRGVHAKEVHQPADAPRLSAEAKVRSDISTRFGGDVDAYRDMLTEAIKSNEKGSDTKNLELLRDRLKVVDVMQRGQEITRNQARTAEKAANIASRAKVEVLQDLLKTGTSVAEYQAGLDHAIKLFQEESSEYEDESPEMENLQMLIEKRKALDTLPLQAETTPQATLEKQLYNQKIETENGITEIRKQMTRNENEIARLTKERDALSRWHWIKRGDLTADIKEKQNKTIELQGLLTQAILSSEKPTIRPEYRAPKVEVSARPEISAEELESLEDEESIAAK